MKNKIAVIVLVGLLTAAGLILIGCDMDNCRGTGQCTVTIGQGAWGLFVDTSVPRTTCGTGGAIRYT
jgi:hypothetical protein